MNQSKMFLKLAAWLDRYVDNKGHKEALQKICKQEQTDKEMSQLEDWCLDDRYKKRLLWKLQKTVTCFKELAGADEATSKEWLGRLKELFPNQFFTVPDDASFDLLSRLIPARLLKAQQSVMEELLQWDRFQKMMGLGVKLFLGLVVLALIITIIATS